MSRINEETDKAIRTYSMRYGTVDEVIPAEFNSGTSTFTRHVTLTFHDGRVEHYKFLLQGSHITNEVKVLSARPYEPIEPEKVLDGTVEPPPVGKQRKRERKSYDESKDPDSDYWCIDPKYFKET